MIGRLCELAAAFLLGFGLHLLATDAPRAFTVGALGLAIILGVRALLTD